VDRLVTAKVVRRLDPAEAERIAGRDRITREAEDMLRRLGRLRTHLNAAG
jgi:hypothetical protein